MLVTDEMVETALGILFPLNAAFNEGAHERLKAKIRSALEAALSHAAGQEAVACPECSAPLLYECVACSASNYPAVARSEGDEL